ncbi:MAG: SHOCT domain-containing protein [Propionibacteriales bacterium]|nr:SHOCT domain-containing protein [Propionibacteriales bacterium]
MDFFHDLGSFFIALLSFFVLVAWLMALFSIVADLFRDRELAGWAKAVWLFFLILIPLFTALIYVIVRGGGMAERAMAQAQASKAEADEYIRSVASGAVGEIAKAKELLDAGAITPEEFATLKAKALA